ncbi:DUF3499 family protein [Stomatohabitans albus]|uniref:DUF3499 family protein n=1 Tax=Stomatohabitans albus TaxID=3110766 RepID=UPI00300CE1B9
MPFGPSSKMRTCVKTGCRWPAVATLAYRYSSSEAWLTDLTPEPDPSTHDLCPHHANQMRVPVGWNLIDDRNPVEPRKEPSANEIVDRANAARLRSQRAQRAQLARPARVNRYAELLAELDELAQSTALATLESDEEWREHGWSDREDTATQFGPVLNAVERANQLAAFADQNDSQDEDAEPIERNEHGEPIGVITAQEQATAEVEQNQRELIEHRLHELLDRIGAKSRVQHPSSGRAVSPDVDSPVHPVEHIEAGEGLATVLRLPLPPQDEDDPEGA